MQLGVVTARQPLVVPRADLLADVATGDPGAEGIGDLLRKLFIAIFDGVIRNTSTCIDDERFCDGVRWTGHHASPAATAKTSRRFIGFKIEGGEQMADHHPRSPLAVDQIAVFPDPAQTGFLRPGFVQQRRGINASSPFAVRTLVGQPTPNSAEPLVHNPVVIPSPSVASNPE